MTRALSGFAALLGLALAMACSSSSSNGPTDPAAVDGGGTDDFTFGGARPVSLFHAPASYDPSKPAPLVVLLHGYGASGQLQDAIFRLMSISDQEGFFLVAPDGTVDSTEHRFWNATDNCCDFDNTHVDDVAYLTGLVAEIETKYKIDPKRRFLVGHSNGGSMAYRLACDKADMFAAVAALAGPFFSDVTKCKPSVPIAVLGLHGTADMTVSYDGGIPPGDDHPELDAKVPGAVAVAKDWAGFDHCAAAPTSEAAMDLDGDIAGAETKVDHYLSCAAGTDVVLWTLQGSGHIPGNLVPAFPNLVYGFLKAHPKP